MPKTKKAQTPQARKQELLDFFKSHTQDAYQVKELKTLLKHKDEATLRRDLENMLSSGELSKEKDKSKPKPKAFYRWNGETTPEAPVAAAAPAKKNTKKAKTEAVPKQKNAKKSNKAAEAVKPAVIQPNKAKKILKPAAPKAAPKAPAKAATKASAKAVVAPAPQVASEPRPKGRASARELESAILKALAEGPATANALSAQLDRKYPTMMKALERMQASGQLGRHDAKRPHQYFIPAQGATAAGNGQSADPVASVSQHSPEAGLLTSAQPAVINLTVNALLDRLIQAERKIWELESRSR